MRGSWGRDSKSRAEWRWGVKECHRKKIELEREVRMLALCKLLVFIGKQATDFLEPVLNWST